MKNYDEHLRMFVSECSRKMTFQNKLTRSEDPQEEQGMCRLGVLMFTSTHILKTTSFPGTSRHRHHLRRVLQYTEKTNAPCLVGGLDDSLHTFPPISELVTIIPRGADCWYAIVCWPDPECETVVQAGAICDAFVRNCVCRIGTCDAFQSLGGIRPVDVDTLLDVVPGWTFLFLP